MGVQSKCLGVADDDMQPMEKAGIRSVGSVLMGVAFQCGDVTAVTVAVDYAAIGKGSVGKFLYGDLLEIGSHLHFQEAGIVPVIQRQCHENFRLFCAPVPLFARCRAAKVRIIEFDDAVQLMGFIPLSLSSTDVFEHEPGSFVGRPIIAAKLND